MADLNEYSAFGSPSALTLHDLYREIRRDPALSVFEGQQLIGQIKGVTKAPGFAPLGKVLSEGRGLGGLAGYITGKYFELGPVGKALTTAIGAGVGKRLYDDFNKPPEIPGWKIIG